MEGFFQEAIFELRCKPYTEVTQYVCVCVSVCLCLCVWYGDCCSQKEQTLNGLHFCHFVFAHENLSHAGPRHYSPQSGFGVSKIAHVHNHLGPSVWTGRWITTEVKLSFVMPCTPSLPELLALFDRLVSESLLYKPSTVTQFVTTQGGIWTQADVGLKLYGMFYF